METIELLGSLGGVVAGITGLILTYQLILIRRHFNLNHKAQRVSKSNDMLMFWVERLDRNAGAARSFVEELTLNQCKKLRNNQEFSIVLSSNTEEDKNRREYLIEKLRVILGESFNNVKFQNELVIIEVSESSKINSWATKYLNATEVVMNAYRHNLVESKIIQEEFKWIIHIGKNYRLMYQFREAAGGDKAFPGIYQFVKDMESQLPKGENPIEDR
ncbi:hypothetical protein [Ekhidna sp.]